MNFQFRSSPFNEEYYRRRWTIRFSILGFTMLLLDSSAMVSLNLVSPNGFSNATMLIYLAPFFVHSLQLLTAVFLLRSQRKDLKSLERCSAWCWRFKILTPLISLESIILSHWDFHLVIILLTISLYLIASIKVNCLMTQSLLPEILNAVNALEQKTGHKVPISSTNQQGLEGNKYDDDASLPSYAEAIRKSYPRIPDLPPNYSDVVPVIYHHRQGR